jgi:hypothetical protein
MDDPHVLYVCLGPEMFGLWEVEFQYEIFNPETNTTEPRNISYPRMFYIRLRRQTFLGDGLLRIFPTFTHRFIKSMLLVDNGYPFNSSELQGTDLESIPSTQNIKYTRQLAYSEMQILKMMRLFQRTSCISYGYYGYYAFVF